jgi:hypothetical protein
MNGDAQVRKAHSSGKSQLESLGDKRDLERRCFEYDRGAVLGQIDSLHQAIDQNSEELALVAEEGVFKKAVSDKLSRTARLLRAVSQELDGLRGQVSKTSNYPTSTYPGGDKKLNL